MKVAPYSGLSAVKYDAPWLDVPPLTGLYCNAFLGLNKAGFENELEFMVLKAL